MVVIYINCRTEVEEVEEFSDLNVDVFPWIQHDCLYFSVESIEFTLHGNIIITLLLVYGNVA